MVDICPTPALATVAARTGRAVGLLAAFALAAACGGGSSGPSQPAPDDPAAPGDPSEPPPADVVVSGRVTYDFVPSAPNTGGFSYRLDYASTEPRPVRGATVEAVAAGSVLATTTTDGDGQYSLTLPAERSVFLRVRAESVRGGTPAWDVRVLNNVVDAGNPDGDAQYVLDGGVFDTGTADALRDLHAPSGWDASQSRYAQPRSAAPFAILDTIRDVMDFVVAADANAVFPALDIYWSPDNTTADSSLPFPHNLPRGEIGTSFYLRGLGIYVLGAEDDDTDEYDRHVIAHEWAHYFEAEFSRSDSIGGPHTFGDRLDMRVAFGEGFGNALAAMALGDPVYRDTLGDQQQSGFSFSVENSPLSLRHIPNEAPGWYSEQSVQELLWDMFDANEDIAADSIELGFVPLYTVLVDAQAETPALTSVFAFLDALKAARPDDAAAIDALSSGQDITPVVDAFGQDEQNDAGANEPIDVIPVYRSLSVNGAPVNVCSSNEFESADTGAENKLASRQFLELTLPATTTYTITVTTTSLPDGADYADPDFFVHRRGIIRAATGEPSDLCKTGLPAACTEQLTAELNAGRHVLDVHEWTNTNAADDQEYPPIGRTCFDVEVTL